MRVWSQMAPLLKINSTKEWVSQILFVPLQRQLFPISCLGNVQTSVDIALGLASVVMSSQSLACYCITKTGEMSDLTKS